MLLTRFRFPKRAPRRRAAWTVGIGICWARNIGTIFFWAFSNRVNTNLAIENSRESSSVDYASLSVILISLLLMCFSIVLLANEAKRSATMLAPAAFSEGSAAKTFRAAQPNAIGEAMAAPSSSPIVETGRRIALPDMERAKNHPGNSWAPRHSNRSIRLTRMRSRVWGSKKISVGLYVPLLG